MADTLGLGCGGGGDEKRRVYLARETGDSL